MSKLAIIEQAPCGNWIARKLSYFTFNQYGEIILVKKIEHASKFGSRYEWEWRLYAAQIRYRIKSVLEDPVNLEGAL